MNIKAERLESLSTILRPMKSILPVNRKSGNDYRFRSLKRRILTDAEKYFGPQAEIVGTDILLETKNFKKEQKYICSSDQTDNNFLETLLLEFASPFNIIDDGSYRTPDVKVTFNILFPPMSKDGSYFMENLHTSYWTAYASTLRSFMKYSKILIDEIAGHPLRTKLRLRESIIKKFTDTIFLIIYYDSFCVFEKALMPPRQSLKNMTLQSKI